MFDEVQCGFGRTGDWCAWRSLGAPEVTPDAISWAKGMAGSFPMGAIWVHDRPIQRSDGTAQRFGRSLRSRHPRHDVRRQFPIALHVRPRNVPHHRGRRFAG